MAEIKTKRLDSYLRLIDISRDLASTLDLNQLLERIVKAAADITFAEAASILLYDNTSRQLYFQVATNLDEPTMRGASSPRKVVMRQLPANLVAFKAKDHVFITWEKVKDADLSHYVVYRKSPKDETFKSIADKVTDNAFKDTQVKEGGDYLYYVTAVDAKGNESKASNVVKN